MNNYNNQTDICPCSDILDKTNIILYSILGVIVLMGILTFIVIWLCSDKFRPNEDDDVVSVKVDDTIELDDLDIYYPTYSTPFRSSIDIKNRKLLSSYNIPTNEIINLCIWVASCTDNANDAIYLLQLIANDVIYHQTFTAYELKKKYKINNKTDNNYKHFATEYFDDMGEEKLINFVIELSPIILEIYSIFTHIFNNKFIGINDKILNYFLEFEISMIVDKNQHTKLVNIKDIIGTDNNDNGLIECIIEIGDLGRYKLILHKNSNYHYALMKNRIGDDYEKTDIYLMENNNTN